MGILIPARDDKIAAADSAAGQTAQTRVPATPIATSEAEGETRRVAGRSTGLRSLSFTTTTTLRLAVSSSRAAGKGRNALFLPLLLSPAHSAHVSSNRYSLNCVLYNV